MKLKSLIQDNKTGILCCVGLLAIFGLLNVFSASYPKAAASNERDVLFFAARQAMWIVIGCIFLRSAWAYDYRKLSSQGWMILMTVATIGLLLATAAFGVEVNGSTRWIEFGFRFQPSEVAKVTAVMLAAGFTGTRLKEGKRCTLRSWQLGAVFLMGALVYLQPDLGTATIIVAIAVVIFCASDLPPKQLWPLIVCVGVGLLWLAGNADYRSGRIQAWYDPWQYRQGAGYQAVQSAIAIGSGGMTGMGPGRGISKHFWLPEAHTDFAFASLCQEWGFILTVLGIIVPFAALAFYGICVAKQSDDYYGKMLAFGLTLLICGQAVANMLMVVNVLPVIGVPLPFISYGGTSLIINMTCVGILLSINTQNKRQRLRLLRIKEREAEKPPEKPPVKLKLVSPLRDGRIDRIKNGK